MNVPSYYKIHKLELNEDEIELYKSNKMSERDLVLEVAKRSPYHPFGYGCFDREIYEYDGTLYAIWKSYNHCD